MEKLSAELMSLDHVKETLDVVTCLNRVADQIKEKSADDGRISGTEAIQILVEEMGSIGEAINGIAKVKDEIPNMCEADAKHLGGEALATLMKLCEAFCGLSV